MAVTVVMVITGLIIVVQTVRNAPKPQDAEGSAWTRFVQQISPPVIVFTALSILVYMMTLEWLGFMLASYLFLVITMRLLGSERWWLNVVVSAVALGLIYLVFRTAFSVILPVGRIWQGVF
jgi:putative tricarboxylic transport membrane protein